jgi:hypothetical protein
MTSPEPWRDVPPPPRRVGNARDPLARYAENTEPSEFGFGPGLVAPCYNGLPPSDGGMYMPKAPPVDEHGRQLPRKPTEARGYPGDQVAR